MRGKRRKAGLDLREAEPEVHMPAPPRVRAAWRELLRYVYEVDPLACPSCGGTMRFVAAITERAVIEKILRHLGRWPPPSRPPRPPPPPEPAQTRLPFPASPWTPSRSRVRDESEHSQVPTWWDDPTPYSQVPPDWDH